MNLLNTLDKWNESKKKLLELIEFKKIELNRIVLTFSGGKDSTVCLKLIEECGLKNKIKVVFMNTLMEYEATIKFIEEKRAEGWVIEETKPKLPAPLIYKKYGVPFLGKKDSEMLSRLQKHNFNWKEIYEPRDYLMEKYPNAKAAIKWLTNYYTTIACPKWLKKELYENGLNFKVANQCCNYLKKKPVYEINKKYNTQLSIQGIRKAEGGVRSVIYKTCFYTNKTNNIDYFFPLFWFSDHDMDEIIKIKDIKISDCYTKYGLKRTGCVGCPFGRNYKKELDVLKEYEPNKYLAVMNLFKDSYELKSKKGNK